MPLRTVALMLLPSTWLKEGAISDRYTNGGDKQWSYSQLCLPGQIPQLQTCLLLYASGVDTKNTWDNRTLTLTPLTGFVGQNVMSDLFHIPIARCSLIPKCSLDFVEVKLLWNSHVCVVPFQSVLRTEFILFLIVYMDIAKRASNVCHVKAGAYERPGITEYDLVMVRRWLMMQCFYFNEGYGFLTEWD